VISKLHLPAQTNKSTAQPPWPWVPESIAILATYNVARNTFLHA